MEAFKRQHLANLVLREHAQYRSENPKSLAVHEAAHHLLTRVPMTWMNKWAGGFPLAFARAHGAVITDVDGHELIDFALGDTGAMAGHSPRPLVRALNE
jgi:glutamate-1-semialdehyde 2,1-aminomutase